MKSISDIEMIAVMILMLKDRMIRKAIINYTRAFVSEEEWNEALKLAFEL